MRTALPASLTLDVLPITQVPLNTKCRDEIIPILAALQGIHADRPTRDYLLDLIGQDVNSQSGATRGRTGLSYWDILVLAAVRLGCNCDYDKLQNLAEEHYTLRRIMGVGTWLDGFSAENPFDWRRLRDNLSKLRPETLEKINTAVVQLGHHQVPEAAEQVRGDTFVVETDIHYPTDASVLADGLRKLVQVATALAVLLGQPGWRQGKHLRRCFKKLVRRINAACKSKKAGARQRRREAYLPLLKLARRLLRRARRLLADATALPGTSASEELAALCEKLQHYVDLTERVARNARRRVVQGEKVPNAEKIFSVFEPHTELVNRGKTPQAIEFGRRFLIIEDRVGFIVHYEVVDRGQQDADIGVEALRKAQEKCAGRIQEASFDRGFHSPANQQAFADVVANPCVPVRGYRQEARQQAEATETFQRQRRHHPGVESLIHGLQAGNGLERCRDKSEEGLKRYVGVAVLGRNLHVLGKLLLAAAAPGCDAGKHRRKKQVG